MKRCSINLCEHQKHTHQPNDLTSSSSIKTFCCNHDCCHDLHLVLKNTAKSKVENPGDMIDETDLSLGLKVKTLTTLTLNNRLLIWCDLFSLVLPPCLCWHCAIINDAVLIFQNVHKPCSEAEAAIQSHWSSGADLIQNVPRRVSVWCLNGNKTSGVSLTHLLTPAQSGAKSFK